jgi:hypothetical protein
MKKILFILFTFVFSSLAFAQTTDKSAVFSFEGKSFDFGDVKEGQKVSHTFTYKNTGNDTLRIDNIVSSCGCTVVNSYQKTVAPGKSSSITIDFNSAGKMGVVNKTITILSNAKSEEPAEFLKIRVNVIP